MAVRNRADFVAMGHRHQKIGAAQSHREVGADGTIVIEDTPMVCSGTFLRHGHDTYATESMLPPGTLGAATLHLYLDRHSVHPRA